MSDSFKSRKININTAGKNNIYFEFAKKTFSYNFNSVKHTTKYEIATDTALDDLTDVQLNGVDDLHILKYDKSSEKWVNQAFSTLLSGYVEGTQIIMSGNKITLDQAKIDHDQLLNFTQTEHRIINDSGTSETELWSASKISTQLDLKASTVHTHTESDITDLDRYSQSQVDTLLAAKAILGHVHTESDVTDLDKFTQDEITSLLSLKAALSHEHVEADITDLDKYTQDQVDVLLAAKALLVHTHNDLYYTQTQFDNGLLDSRYYTETELDVLLAAKASITHNHDDRYYLDTEVDGLFNSHNATYDHTELHEHINKALLDTYLQTEANLSDAVSKKHTQNTDTCTTSNTFHIGDGTNDEDKRIVANDATPSNQAELRYHIDTQTWQYSNDGLTFADIGSGGTSDVAMSDLTDVDLTDLANNKILKYNSTTEKWECVDESGGGAGVWGSITGTLSNQTDLQSELDAKSDTGHTHVIADVTDYTAYTLPTATDTILGGVKIGNRITITAGVISADVQSDVNFTSTLKNKLDGIDSGAEVNVNADWDSVTGDSQILNKPTIPTALSDLSDDSTHRLVTDTEKSTWNAKSDLTLAEVKLDTDIASAISLKHSNSLDHTQNSDTDLDPTFEATFVKKLDTVNVLSDITSAGADIESAVSLKHDGGAQDTAIGLNTAKETNVSTQLSTGTVNATTYGITSDGGVDDIVLVEATTNYAGLLGADKWNEIVANTLAKHAQNTDTALGAQSENLDMNTHKIVGVVDPDDNQDAATKKYVDDAVSGENLWDRADTTLSPHNANDSIDLGTGTIIINSIEIVGADGEVNKAAVEDSENWDTAYTHSQITTGNPHAIDITDLSSYAHNSLSDLNSGDYLHLTAVEYAILHPAVTVAGAPLTLSTQELTFNYDTDEFQLNGNDLQIKEIDCAKIKVGALNTPTYSTLCDAFNLFTSAGRLTGGEVTQHASDETVDVAAGTGVIRIADDDTSEVKFFNIPATTEIAIPTDTVRYIVVDYNTGTEAITVTAWSTEDWDKDTEFPLAKVVNQGGAIHIINNPWWVGDSTTNIIERFESYGYYQRDADVGGLLLSVSDEVNQEIAVTAGKIWSRLNEYNITKLDTNVSGTFCLNYESADGVWTTNDVTAYPITHWNDVETTHTLVALTSKYYMNIWFYVNAGEDKFCAVYGQAQYNKSAECEAESPPTYLPEHVEELGMLIGRIIVKEGEAAPIQVDTAFNGVSFTPSQAADHNNLTSLQGGAVGEYYHLTAAEYTELTAWLDDVTLGASGALTLPTGQNFTIGTTQWNSGDSIDADSIVDGSTNAVITLTQETNFETAYSHSQDNSQAHTDYLINNGADETSGILTAGGFVLGTDLKMQFRDANVYINSIDDGHLDLTADISIDLNADVVMGASSLTINSVEIVGSDGEVNKAAVEDSGNWDDAYSHISNDGTDHSFIDQDLQQTATPTFAGLTIVNAITEFSTDGTLGDDSDSAIPTEKAVKKYVDDSLGLTWNESISGTSGDGLTISIDGQAGGDIDLINLDTNNTDSVANVSLIHGTIDDNVGAGVNSGIFLINNNAQGYSWAASTPPSGTGIHIYQTSTASSISLYGANNVNCAAIMNIGVSDTQSGASKLLRLDIGAADEAMEAIQVTGDSVNAAAVAFHADMQTGFGGDFIQCEVNNVEKFAIDKDGNLTIIGDTTVALDKHIYFGDTGVHIQSDDDGYLDLTADAGVRINSAYTFPLADGNANEFLKTDGSGALSFVDLINSDFGTFVDADLTAGVLTITHALSSQYVFPVIYDNDNKVIVPDEYTATSTSVLTVDLSSYGTITGTWNYSIVARNSSLVTYGIKIQDADADTYINCEATSDVDEIVMVVTGTEALKIESDGTIVIPLDKKIEFGDSGVHIQSDDDGHLDLTADTSIDLNGAAYISGNVGIKVVTARDNLHIFSDTVGGGDGLLIAPNAANLGLQLSYEHNSGSVYIDELYDATSGDMIFRTRAAGTPITVLTLTGEGDTVVTGDLYTTAWTDYEASSTVVGWSSYSTKQIRYKKVGKLVFVEFYLGGTSNSTSTSFTLPYAMASTPGGTYFSLGFTYDNTAYVNPQGVGGLTASGSTVVLYKTLAASSAGWTASGDKIVIGQFFYEAT